MENSEPNLSNYTFEKQTKIRTLLKMDKFSLALVILQQEDFIQSLNKKI
tara:strand:- start:119 stop:265 length:147 start_codon:yes stop_codon:yes gene_type:complete